MNNMHPSSRLTPERYQLLYAQSISDPDAFWAEQAQTHLSWHRPWTTVHQGAFSEGTSTWFDGGILNVSYNCIDRHVENGHGDQTAYFFERNDGSSITISYKELLNEVSRLANVLKDFGIKKGDRVCIYMPMIPEAIYAMLACTRIGAVHTVVFGGFSAEALLARIEDASCALVITADVSVRGDKTVPLLDRVIEILDNAHTVSSVLAVRTTAQPLGVHPLVHDYRTFVDQASPHCEPEWMEAEDPLFILYTSGSTGKPKGALHTTGGYLLYAAMTHHYVFDHHTNDIYWCTADIGWITGHTYIVYGPLCNKATSVFFEGTPTYPDASRYWNIVDKYGVTIFYSTPTAIRMLMAQGDSFVEKTSRKSLRILGTVGEPINPEAWRWYHEVVGGTRCFIVDTWWQTETGGHAITPLPGVVDPKPGAAMIPFFGIQPVLVDEQGKEIQGIGEGTLLLKGPWPGHIRDLYGDHERFLSTYFRPYPGYYVTGDSAKRDADGNLWITGRIDDTMNIAGRLIGTAEVESALVLHPKVAEAAVVAVPDPLSGWVIHAYTCLITDTAVSTSLTEELLELVKTQVGSFAKPKKILFVPGLPKTRSGKIMRRLLRKIAHGELDTLGDTSTLAEPEIITAIIAISNSR